MIEEWRSSFAGGASLTIGPEKRQRPFLFVQLAPYTEGAGEPHDASVALVREAQAVALLSMALPVVAMSSAIDYGDIASPLGNIHPRYKAPVGLRLALAARVLAYQEQGVVYAGPTLAKAKPCQNTTSTATATATSAALCVELQFDGPVLLMPPLRGPCPVKADQVVTASTDFCVSSVAHPLTLPPFPSL
jgi:hypothetical protein